MLKLEVLNSIDADTIGIYKYHKNQISIGEKKSNDIIISKDHLYSDIIITISDRGLLITSKNYQSNGKKISGSKVHSINDVISVNTLEFKIIDFKFDESPNLNEAYQKRIQDNPELEGLFSALKNELIHIERESNVK